MVATALLALASAFQIGLAAGARWGAAAYGGRAVLSDGGLPIAYRWASVVAALTLIGVMWVVLASVSLVGRGSVSGSTLTVLLWALTAVLSSTRSATPAATTRSSGGGPVPSPRSWPPFVPFWPCAEPPPRVSIGNLVPAIVGFVARSRAAGQ